MRGKWTLVERVARNMVCNLNADGKVNRKALKQIVAFTIAELHPAKGPCAIP